MKSTIHLVFILACIFAIPACQNNEPHSQHSHDEMSTKVNPSASTLEMIDSINAIIARTDFRKHLYESERKSQLIAKEVNQAQANNTLTQELYVEYALALLNAGKTQESLNALNTLLQNLPQNQKITDQTKVLHETIALCHLRLGEQANCIANHTAESCLFPIKGSGIHKDQAGSRNAIKKYEEILALYPTDLRSIWLLNLAYMTIGDYPEGVPAKFLIPPSQFNADYQMPVFENIATSVGLDVGDLAGGVILDDFNNDGWTDVIVSSWSMFGQVRIFINDTHGGYIDKTKSSGLSGLVGGLNLIQADYNNDGHLDFYIIRGAWRGYDWMGQLPNSLIRNNGDGSFTDVTIESGVYYAAPTQSAVWTDINVDGWIDLVVGNETHSDKEKHTTQLLINDGQGGFNDMALSAGVNTVAYIKGVNVGDVNNDGLPDLYFSIISGPNKLWINQGGATLSDWRFIESANQWNAQEPLESFPTWFFDFDNDGDEDLFVSSFDRYSLYQQSREVAADYLGIPSNSDFPRLYKNSNGQQYEDVTTSMGLDRIIPTMGCNYGDLDGDGWLDFYLGTGAPDLRAVVPNRMFRNNKGQSFQDVTTSGNFGHVQKGHGIAFDDLDKDGDEDIYAVMGGSVSGDIAQNALFENPGTDHNWVHIKLIGTNKSNRSAIGAKIKLTLLDSNNEQRHIYRTISSGASFGANSLNQIVGLGNASKIENISVRWPNGSSIYVDYGDAPINSYLQIAEGQFIQQLDFTPQSFRKEKHEHYHHH